MVSHPSAVAGLNSGQFNRKGNFIGTQNKFSNGNLFDLDCGSGFQPRLYDGSYKATFFAAGSRSHEKLM